MAQVIGTNIASLRAQTSLNQTNSGLNEALARLSSGKRINSAKDDAAGIAIAARFTAQIKGTEMGVRNSADAISMAQTADSALGEIANNLQRIRELAVQSANVTNSTSDRSALDAEVTELEANITQIQATKYNDISLLTTGSHTFQTGAETGDTVALATTAVSYTAGSVTSAAAATTQIGNVDTALDAVNTERAKMGAAQNRFESIIRNGESLSANLQDGRGRIEDTDFAKETAKLTKFQILQQAGVSVLSQANSMPQSVLGLLG